MSTIPAAATVRYPSSAELAAYRRRIAQRYGSPLGTFTEPADHSAASGLLHPHAWSQELAHGIGYRSRRVSTDWSEHAAMRREASAMRSRAYSRMGRGTQGQHDALYAAVDVFQPTYFHQYPH